MSFKIGDHVVVVRGDGRFCFVSHVNGTLVSTAHYIGMKGVVASDLEWAAPLAAVMSHRVELENGESWHFVPPLLRKLAPPGQQDWVKLCDLRPLEVVE